MVKYFLFALGSLLLLSCGKEDDNYTDLPPEEDNPESEETAYRIKQIISNLGTYDNKRVFIYDDDKLVETILYKEDGIGNMDWEVKKDFSYSGNIVTINKEVTESSNNSYGYDRTELQFQDGRIVEEYSVLDGLFFAIHKKTYQYSGDDLICWEMFHDNDENGEYELFQSGEYIYQDDKKIAYKEFDYDEEENGILKKKIQYFYEEGVMVGSIEYERNEIDGLVKSDSARYFYDEGIISRIDRYFWNEIYNSWSSISSQDFYNENGSLIEKVYSNGEKDIFEYEEGKGNTELFYDLTSF